MIKDVTEEVDIGSIDDEHLPITKCVCGKIFEPWDFIISIYKDDPYSCPNCKRKLYFTNSIKIYEVVEKEE
jgi:hypothetical protein